MSTAAQAAASRENSLHSTGPRTAEGKQTASLNALRHGATSRSLLLPGEDPAEFEKAKQALICDLRPSSEAELLQATQVAEHSWRLARMYKAEASLFAGRMKELGAEGPEALAMLFTDPKEAHRLRLFLRYLASAERAYNKTLADYRRMQKENRAAEKEQRSKQNRRNMELAWIDSLEDSAPGETAYTKSSPGFVSQPAARSVAAVQPTSAPGSQSPESAAA